jgi:uncharacterized protein
MFKFLLPKDEPFFELFDKMSANIVEGVQLLNQMLDPALPACSEHARDELARQLKTVEHQTDGVAHQIISKLHKTFITPIEREDIFHLVGRLDDILDLAEGAGSRIELYKPKAVPYESVDLARTLLESVRLVQEMIHLLSDMKKSARILELTVEINRLEHEADQLRRGTLARLFREEKDVFELIKWKDIQEYMEKATDRCEDVANITEGIVLENT